jgi:hypothetical protein
MRDFELREGETDKSSHMTRSGLIKTWLPHTFDGWSAGYPAGVESNRVIPITQKPILTTILKYFWIEGLHVSMAPAIQ